MPVPSDPPPSRPGTPAPGPARPRPDGPAPAPDDLRPGSSPAAPDEHPAGPPGDGADADPGPGSGRLDQLLATARATVAPRPGPDALAGLVAEGALVVDIRPEADRRAEGELPGAVVIERNVLEWRLEPGGAHRLAEAGDPGRVVVLVCNEGYASSLAAATLRDLGLPGATDLDGGYRAWAASQSID